MSDRLITASYGAPKYLSDDSLMIIGNEPAASVSATWNGGVKGWPYGTTNIAFDLLSWSYIRPQYYDAVYDGSDFVRLDLKFRPYGTTLKWIGTFTMRNSGLEYVINIELTVTAPDCSPSGTYTITGSTGFNATYFDEVTAFSIA